MTTPVHIPRRLKVFKHKIDDTLNVSIDSSEHDGWRVVGTTVRPKDDELIVIFEKFENPQK
jgi:hypothetical protein